MIRLIDLYEGVGIRLGALEFLYKLMEERQTEPEVNISHKELPSFEHHRAFWTRRPYRFAYLIEAADFETKNSAQDHPWIGYISTTARNEIGIVLLKGWRGHGFGPEAVRAFIAKHQPNCAVPSEVDGYWLANIAPGNEHSKQMFQRLGFHKISETYALEEEPHGQETGPAAPA